jgi:hypothetical protein
MPNDVRIKASGTRLSLDTLLTMYVQADSFADDERRPGPRASALAGAAAALPSVIALPSAALPGAALPPLPPNPFDTGGAARRYAAIRRTPVLIGVMRGSSRSAALFALGDAAALVRAGGVIESSRVASIGSDYVTLVGGDAGARMIRLAGEAK